MSTQYTARQAVEYCSRIDAGGEEGSAEMDNLEAILLEARHMQHAMPTCNLATCNMQQQCHVRRAILLEALLALLPRHALTRCKAKTRRCARCAVLRCFGLRPPKAFADRRRWYGMRCAVCARCHSVVCRVVLALQKQRSTEAKLTRAKLELDEKSATCAKLEAELAALQVTCNCVTTV